MIVYEFKVKGKEQQYQAINEAIRTSQFIQNSCLRYWMDNKGVGKYELNKYCAVLAAMFPFADELNSMARQSAAERSWSAISRFYDNCKRQVKGKKGFPKFKKHCHSVEYKTSGWQLSSGRKSITFTDKKSIGTLKLKGTYDLSYYNIKQIKRVRLVRRADGYYAQFAISVERNVEIEPTHQTIGLDVGLESFYTDSLGKRIENPRFYRSGEKRLKKFHRRVSKKVKKSSNRRKARTRLGRTYLKISRQRKDHAVKLARCVITSNDVVVYEDLRIKNMVKNHCLAKSINDAGWHQFRMWLEYFGKVFKRITVAVAPAYTSQECSVCGAVVKKSLSTRTHICQCGCRLDRDENAALNILTRGIATVGHTGSSVLDTGNAWGEITSTLAGVILPVQVVSLNQESQSL